jgi:molybdopterin-containing oxidoreductase family molybdopterin binding subunit
VNEIRETDTTLFADYVLPEAPVQEREDIVSAPGDCLVLLEPAVEPQGESRVSADLWRGLAESIGLGEYFQKTQNDWIRMKLDHQPPELATVEPPITYERLKEEKIIALNTPEDVIDIVFEKMEFPTFSGRIEFYSEEMAHTGRAMATYQPARIHGERKADYPIHFFPGRSRFFMQGQFTEHPELRELAGKQSTIRLNPKTAKDRDIKEGDMVEAFNERGVCRAPAHLSNAIPPDMAYVLYAYPAKDYTADPPTALAPAMGSADTQDDFSRAIPGLRAKLNSNVPDIFLLPATPDAYETFWDELVEIRKA